MADRGVCVRIFPPLVGAWVVEPLLSPAAPFSLDNELL